MIRNSTYTLLTLALGIVISSSHAQNQSSICSLGDIKPEQISSIDSLKIKNSDLQVFKNSLASFNQLTYLEFTNEFSDENLVEAFTACNSIPELKTIKLSNNELIEFPSGIDFPNEIETLIIADNELIDYSRILDQICDISSLKKLQVEVYSIFDLPAKPKFPTNLKEFTIINVDDVISENENTIKNSINKHTYDFVTTDDPSVQIKYISIAGMLDSDEYQELSKRFKSYHSYSFALNNYSSESSSYIPTYNYVTPPIKGLDIDRTVYKINNSVDNLLIYPSGTRILIPADCFTNKNNKTVSGNVEITYREFRDPVDILVSGIPMKYDSAGEVNHFESAGMFEINASQNSEPLSLQKGKQIKMNFVTTSKDSTFNFYAFNDTSGNWEYITKPSAVTNDTKIIDPNSPATNVFRRLSNSKPKYYDTATFRSRFESPEFLYTVRFDSLIKKNNTVWYNKYLRHYGRKTESLVKINRIRKTRSGEITFKIRFYKESHPELNSFNNVYFVSNENLSLSEFKKKFASHISFNDIRIYQNGQQVKIRLKGKGEQFRTVSADLATIDHNNQLHNLKSITNILRKYNRRLREREKEFDKLVKKGKNSNDRLIELSNPKDIDLYAFNGTKPYMNANENKMTQKEWMTYYSQLMKNQKLALDTSAATANNLVNSLSLDGLGIYNCDQIQRLKDPVEIFADYHDKQTKEVKPTATYIIDKKINAVLQYNGYRGYSADKIAFSRSENAENVMLAIKPDGTLSIYTVNDFKNQKFRNKSKFDFLVKEVDVNFTTVAQLKKYIGL